MAEIDKEIGFTREEMYSCNLNGDVDGPWKVVFVVYGEYNDWGKRLEEVEGSPIQTFQRSIKEKQKEKKMGKVSVLAVPKSSEHDEEGDVLIFPDRIRIKNGVERVQDIVQALWSSEPLDDAKELEKGGHVFVCCHESRDARCGYCGPKIIAALNHGLEKTSKPVFVRACSHLGGHKHAGNLIVARDDNEKNTDWLGYITDSKTDTEYVLKLANNELDHPSLLTWRGRGGVSKQDHIALCNACSGGVDDIEDLLSKQKPNVIFVLGAPGSGKGTQSSLITEAFDFVHLSAGDLLREERNREGSETGQLISNYIKEGKIVPVAITVQLLLNAMDQNTTCKNFLIDGFPRNADNLDGWKRVVKNDANVLGVLFFDCPEDVVERRLLERGKTSGRTDDNIESIRKRFKTYNEDTKPIIDLYAHRGKCFTIPSDRSVDQVFQDVNKLFSQKLGFHHRQDYVPPKKSPISAVSSVASTLTQPTFPNYWQKVALGAMGAAVVLYAVNRALRNSD